MNQTTLKLQKELVVELKKYSGQGTKHTGNPAYLGNSHFSYHISNPIIRTITKGFIARHEDISLKEFTDLLDALFAAHSHDEKSIAGMLLWYFDDYRKKIDPRSLDTWLSDLKGWAEIDSLCQSNFTAEELLSKWSVWKKLLITFSHDADISKRRASIVLLTAPSSQSADPRLKELAFKNIATLTGEKDILITKAISWLLRSMVKHHKKEVALYIKENITTLPKIAIRETQRKIETGRK